MLKMANVTFRTASCLTKQGVFVESGPMGSRAAPHRELLRKTILTKHGNFIDGKKQHEGFFGFDETLGIFTSEGACGL